MIQQVCFHFLLIVWVNLEFTPFPWVIFENIKKIEFKNLKFNMWTVFSFFLLFGLIQNVRLLRELYFQWEIHYHQWVASGQEQENSKEAPRNLTVYCCVIQRLVTSNWSDWTQNDPGHPDNEWGWLLRRLGGPQGLK